MSRLLGELVAGLGALGAGGEAIDGVGATGGANGELFVWEEGHQVLARGCVAFGFLVLEGPLLFGAVYLAEVGDAGILLSSLARFNEVGNSNG